MTSLIAPITLQQGGEVGMGLEEEAWEPQYLKLFGCGQSCLAES